MEEYCINEYELIPTPKLNGIHNVCINYIPWLTYGCLTITDCTCMYFNAKITQNLDFVSIDKCYPFQLGILPNRVKEFRIQDTTCVGGKLPNDMDELFIHNCELEFKPYLDIFANNLRTLTILNVDIGDLIPCLPPQLEYLRLEDCKINKIWQNALPNSITDLTLKYNGIVELDAEFPENMKYLTLCENLTHFNKLFPKHTYEKIHLSLQMLNEPLHFGENVKFANLFAPKVVIESTIKSRDLTIYANRLKIRCGANIVKLYIQDVKLKRDFYLPDPLKKLSLCNVKNVCNIFERENYPEKLKQINIKCDANIDIPTEILPKNIIVNTYI